MPREFRSILFSPEEIVPVLVQLTGVPGGHAAAGQVALHESAAGDLTATLVARLPDGRRLVRAFAREELLSALLMLCRALMIPLPRSAEKSVERMGRDIALSVSLSSQHHCMGVERATSLV
ncbi:hypothetical protein J5Y09_20700 [Roseomonas sp. PWR1]|uniref:Uncharacterized protein n=1 Tax=Roseomonas nitratireducens TaxID=2820810 RepID=A0ABS4AYA9_9PROT|nr:hypothetical protein [Neoroseomonas nitratireducens]MBP0466360.1 hypothetical protein [Neoroseomonas nitratireducens]